MFTGLIEVLGVVESVANNTKSARLTIRLREAIEGIKIGDSIATNGVCLTVSDLLNNGVGAGDKHPFVFVADVMPVTMAHTNLNKLKSGSLVNLERAMQMSDRFDGHIVTGHVDTTGKIMAIMKDSNAVKIRISLEKQYLSKVIDRGSIAVDGISLTIQEKYSDSFGISIIPHTAKVTTLMDSRVGDEVNIETDVIGKYVAQLMGHDAERGITTSYLENCGFI